MMTSFWLVVFVYLSSHCALCVNVPLSLVINKNYTVKFNTNTYKIFLKTMCNTSTEEFSAEINNEMEVENIHQIALATESPKSQLGFNYICTTIIYKATVPISHKCIRADLSEIGCSNCYTLHLEDATLCGTNCVGIMWTGYSYFSVIHDSNVLIQRGLCGYQATTVSVRENTSSGKEIIYTPTATIVTEKELLTAKTRTTTEIPSTSRIYSTLFQTNKAQTTLKLPAMPVKDKSTTSRTEKSTTSLLGKFSTPVASKTTTYLTDKSTVSLSRTSTTPIIDKTTTSLPGNSATSLSEKSTASLPYKTTGAEIGRSTSQTGISATSLTGKSTISPVTKPTSMRDKSATLMISASTSSVLSKSTFVIARSTTPTITTTAKDLKMISSTTKQTTERLLTTSVSKIPPVTTTEKEIKNTIPLKDDPATPSVSSTTPKLNIHSVKSTTSNQVHPKTTVEIKGNNHVKETDGWELTPLGTGLIAGLCAAIVIILVILIIIYKLRPLMLIKESREVTVPKQIIPPPPAPSKAGKKCVRFQVEDRRNFSQWWL